MTEFILHEKVVIVDDKYNTEVYAVDAFLCDGKYLNLVSPTTGKHIARPTTAVRPASLEEKHTGSRIDKCTSCFNDGYDNYIQYTPCFNRETFDPKG